MDDETGIGRQLLMRARERYEGEKSVSFVDISLPHSSYGIAVYYICVASEVSANLARYDGMRYGTRGTEGATIAELYMKNRGKGLGPETKRRIVLGTYSLSAG